MAWFKVDDTFSVHPKTRRAGNAAIGLWVRCGAWSSCFGTEGHVPLSLAREFGSRREIEQLVEAGLWEPNGDGYRMHDFLDYNPTKEHEARRKQLDRERKRRWRERHEDGGQSKGRDA